MSYYSELHMTNDSNLFEDKNKLENSGYKRNKFDFWIDNENEVAAPLYEGRMIGQFNCSKKGWLYGKGRNAKWETIGINNHIVGPQYLMKINEKSIKKFDQNLKIGFLNITSATNTRTVIASLNKNFPHGHSVPVLKLENESLLDYLIVTSFLNSFVFDYVARQKLGGINFSWFIMREMIFPFYNEENKKIYRFLAYQVALLSFTQLRFAPELLEFSRILNFKKDDKIKIPTDEIVRKKIESNIKILYFKYWT